MSATILTNSAASEDSIKSKISLPGLSIKVNLPSSNSCVADNIDEPIKFCEVLSCTATRALFMQFLEKEASEENLLFWEDVENYRTVALQRHKKLLRSPKEEDKVTLLLTQEMKTILQIFKSRR